MTQNPEIGGVFRREEDGSLTRLDTPSPPEQPAVPEASEDNEAIE